MKQIRIAVAALVLLMGNSLCSICIAQNGINAIRISYTLMDGPIRVGNTTSTGSLIRSDNTLLFGYSINIEADLLNLNSRLSLGAHIGYSPSAYLKPAQPVVQLSPAEYIWFPGIHYGVNLHYNLLPDNPHWDLSLNGMIGSYWTLHLWPAVEFGTSISATYYPIEHWGFFAETGWGKYNYTCPNSLSGTAIEWYGHTMAKAGVSYRF